MDEQQWEQDRRDTYLSRVRGEDHEPLLGIACWSTSRNRWGEHMQLVQGASRTPIPLVHQAAGLLCHQVEMIFFPLVPREDVRASMVELYERYDDSCLSAMHARLQDLVEYQRTLRTLFGASVSCEHSWRYLHEAIYPIDLSPAALKALTSETDNLDTDDFLVWPSVIARLGAQWSLVILTPNSD